MASFTDIIPQFNPYVQQLPVEAMVQVGMAKQKAYEENVTKIQGEIDRVAGLDIIRGVDKEYLQSKMNALGNKLTLLAGGDFSNFQLANSVTGMAGQISKDKFVQNAVSSTAFYRKELEALNKAEKEGKGNPSNSYNFKRKANKYLSSTDLNDSFSDKYIEYYDVDKHVREAFKDLQKDGYTVEQIFQMNEDGSFSKDAKGRLIYNPVMTRLEREGIFPKKVKDTLDKAMSDPRVGQQLQIDGEYNYRAYDSGSLKEKLVKGRDAIIAGLRAQIGEVNVKKGAGQDVGNEIENLESTIEAVTKRYDDAMGLADSNPDAIRGMLYKDETKDNWTGMYTSIIDKKTTHENPAWNQMFKQQQEANRVKEAEDRSRLGWYEASISKGRLDLDREKMYMDFRIAEMKEKGKLTEGGKPTIDFMEANMSFVQDELDGLTVAANNLSTSSDNLLYQAYFDPKAKKWVDDQVASGKMSKDRAINGVIVKTAQLAGKDPNEWRTNALYSIKNKWNSPDATVNKDDKNALNSAITASKQWTDLSAKKKTIDDRVKEEARRQGIQYADPSEYIKGIGSKEFSGAMTGGKKITLTSQDMYDIAIANIQRNAVVKWGELGGEDFNSAAKQAEDRLRAKGLSKFADLNYGTMFGLPVQAFGAGQSDWGIAKGSPAGEAIRNIQLKIKSGGLFKGVELRGKVLQESGYFAPNLKKSVLTGDSETDKSRRAEVAAMYSSYVKANQNAAPGFIDNSAKIGQAIEDGSFSIHTNKNDVTGEITSTLRFLDKKGNDAGEMQISNDEAFSIGQNVASFYEPTSVTNAKNRIGYFQNGTTSMSGNVKDVETYRLGDAMLTEEDFPYVRNVPIKANVKQQTEYTNDGPVTRYYGYVYTVKDGKEKIHVTPPSESLEKALGVLQRIDQTMLQSIK